MEESGNRIQEHHLREGWREKSVALRGCAVERCGMNKGKGWVPEALKRQQSRDSATIRYGQREVVKGTGTGRGPANCSDTGW